MIKVVQVSSDSNIGGAGKCILTFLRTFDRSRFDVSVVLPKGSLLKAEAEKCNVKVYEAESIAEKSLSFKGIKELKMLFKEVNPHIVHAHASMSARIAAKFLKIPTVYTRHSVFPPSKTISKGLGKKINGFINNHTADKIIAVAEAAKDNLTDVGIDEKKITVILNGVDGLNRYSEDEIKSERQKLGIDNGKKIAVMAARLTEVKGQKYFIEAAKILKERGLDFVFLIAGTGDTEENLKKLIKEYDLCENVKMLGFVEDMQPVMNVMDVQVNCSFGTEATSLALLEGMSIGKPAVVTDFGGNPGVIKDGVNGYLVSTHDALVIADKIEVLFKDKAIYEEMSNGAIKIYKEKFTSDVYAKNIEEIYNEIIKSK